MKEETELSETLQDIKNLMERSSRFISLSGFSGIAAGICALIGSVFAYRFLSDRDADLNINVSRTESYTIAFIFSHPIFRLALLTFIAALLSAFLFTYIRSKKNNIPIWGTTARRLIIHVAVPMLAGFLFIIKLISIEAYTFIAPSSLIFYGLAIINASKFTLPETIYLGYGLLLLGVVNLWFPLYGLQFWAAGFGLLHIIYGAGMWYKYERIQ